MQRRSARVLSIVLGIPLAAFSAAVVAYKIAYPSFTHRLRLTIEVNVRGQLRTGSGVIEITWRSQPQLGQAPPWLCSINGDAVVVDLGNDRFVFALLRQMSDERGHYRGTVCVMALRSYGFRESPSQEVLEALSRKRGRVAVVDRVVPTFITFTDDSDPASGAIVQRSDFPALFGGAQLTGMWVELTDEPVTRKIVEAVPAAREIIKQYTGRKLSRRGIFQLWGTDFTQPLEAQTPYVRRPIRRRETE
jgi:hypothetical protein